MPGNTSFGGKADGLFFLQANGFQVPAFYVISHELLKDMDALPAAQDFIDTWIAVNSINTDQRWAVRSSADVEDGKTKSFAGMFCTEINLSVDELAAAVLKVREGFFSSAVRAYNGEGQFRFHIVLQEMLAPDFSGVGFSVDPLNPADDCVLINTVPGLGATLVSGEENALVVRLRNKQSIFANADETFGGKKFTGKYEAIAVDGKQFSTAVSPILPELEKGIRRLAALKKHAVDVEFAVCNGQLFWLQVRPVTVLAKKPAGIIWDNSNIGENFPGVTMPLTVTLAKRAYGTSYSAMGRFIGAGKKFEAQNRELLYNMVGAIDGGMYYNVTAWQQLLYQAPFGKRASRLITKMWGTDDAAFEKPVRRSSPLAYLRLLFNFTATLLRFGKHRRNYLQAVPGVLKDYSDGLLIGKSQEELVQLYLTKEKEFGQNWVVPMFNGFLTLIVFSALKKAVQRSRLAVTHPNYVNDILFSSGDVISVTIVRDLQHLLEQIRNDAVAKFIFDSQRDPAEMNVQLQQKAPAICKEIYSYISKYGERCEDGELRMEAVNYKEDPLRFIAMLKNNLGPATIKSASAVQFDYRAAVRKEYPFNFLKRWMLLRLTRATVNRVRDRENFRFMRTRFFSMVRFIFRAVDHDLLKNGWIDNRNDSLYLESDELLNPQRRKEYRELISRRKAEYVIYRNTMRPYRYVQTANGFEPVEKETAVDPVSGIKGVGCCSGIVEAPVLIIDASNVHSAGSAGNILVAKYFEPGWLNLFANASGLVSERGSLLSHTAILCREMGIPSIVGVTGISSKLKTGDRIRMNGGTGKIEILGHGQ